MKRSDNSSIKDFHWEQKHRTGLSDQVYPDVLPTLASGRVAFQICPPANQQHPDVMALLDAERKGGACAVSRRSTGVTVQSLSQVKQPKFVSTFEVI